VWIHNADKTLDYKMEILVFLSFTLLPLLVSGYFSYVYSTVKGYNKTLWTIAGLTLGIAIPFMLFALNPRENKTHYSYPDPRDILFKAPATIRKNPDKSTKEESGYLYLTEDSLIWIPKYNTDSYTWDYAYGLNLGKSRLFKSSHLRWLLLPKGYDSSQILALTLGTAGAFYSLQMACAVNAHKNQDTEIINQFKPGERFKQGDQNRDNRYEEDND
jgi:hypothetical protein